MDKLLWEKAVAFHGHACPGLAIGARMCETVQERLGLSFSPDEELVCIAETDSCPADAIQAILGCSFGKGNLLYRPTGKTAYNFYERAGGKSIRLVSRRGDGSLSREERIAQILRAPASELFTVTPVKYPLPQPARIFSSVACSLCGEEAAEPMMRLRQGKPVCLHCAEAFER